MKFEEWEWHGLFWFVCIIGATISLVGKFVTNRTEIFGVSLTIFLMVYFVVRAFFDVWTWKDKRKNLVKNMQEASNGNK